MSDVQTGAGEQSEANAPVSPAKGTSPLRLVILLLIFGIALACLLYDYCIARPAQKDAYNAILGLLDGTTPDPSGDGTVTEDEVQSILGCKPTETKALSNGKIETYTWRSGLPYRTYSLFVVYSGQKMPLLHFASTEVPQPSDLPPAAIIKNPTQEEIDAYVPANPGASSGPGATGRGAKSGKGRGNKSGDSAAKEQDAAKEQPKQDEPQVEPSAQKEGSTEEATTEEPATEEPATEEPATEEPATEEPAKSDEAPAKQEGGDQ